MGKFIDIKGQRFGFWVALERGDKNKNGQTQWLCECECGTKKLVTLNSLRTGNSTSCGCNHKPDLTGQRFGDLVVVKLDHYKSGRRNWLCQCSCGKTVIKSTYQLRVENISSCGNCQKSIEAAIINTTINNVTTTHSLSDLLHTCQQNLSLLRENLKIMAERTDKLNHTMLQSQKL